MAGGKNNQCTEGEIMSRLLSSESLEAIRKEQSTAYKNRPSLGAAFTEASMDVYLLLQHIDALTEQLAENRYDATCPCQLKEITPCRSTCTCRNQFMSGGCSRCATYGSHEQQVAAAQHLVGLEQQVRSLKDQQRKDADAIAADNSKLLDFYGQIQSLTAERDSLKKRLEKTRTAHNACIRELQLTREELGNLRDSMEK